MRIVVLGGAGAMGRVCVRDLAASGVDEIVVADANGEAASEVARTASRAGTTPSNIIDVQVDVRDSDALVKAVAGADVVANCVNYAFNRDVMRAAARAKVDYLDLGGLYRGTLSQLELEREMEDAGILCLLGMGSTPGTMNVMATAGARVLDEVTEIHLRCGGSDPQPSSAALPAPYAIDTILDEFTLPAVVLAGGRLREIPAASQDEIFDYPDPVGPQLSIATLHSELATMPRTFADRGVREVTFKVAFGEEFVQKYRTVARLGLASTEPVRMSDAGEVIPRDLLKRLALAEPHEFSGKDVESLTVVLRGTRDGESLEIRVEEVSPPNDAYGVGGADANTGIAPSIAAQLIAEGVVAGVGIKAPEEVVPPDRYFAELAKRGITVDIKEGPVSDVQLRVAA